MPPAFPPFASIPFAVPVLASSGLVDAVVALLVVCFLVWGALRGARKQAAGLLGLCGALVAASAVGPAAERHVATVATLAPDDLACVSWLCVLLCALLVASVLLHLAKDLLGRGPPAGPFDRATGAALGLVTGLLSCLVLSYALLGATDPASGPDFTRDLRRSRTATAFARLETRLHPLLRLPPRVAGRVLAVNASLHERTP